MFRRKRRAPGERPEIPHALPDRLSAALPVGIDVLTAAGIDGRTNSLQEEVTSCTWLVGVAGVHGAAELSALVGQAMAAESLVITRQRKGQSVTDDVRPSILAITPIGTDPSGRPTLRCDLATQPRGLRPSELLVALRPAQRYQARIFLHPATPIGLARQAGWSSACLLLVLRPQQR